MLRRRGQRRRSRHRPRYPNDALVLPEDWFDLAETLTGLTDRVDMNALYRAHLYKATFSGHLWEMRDSMLSSTGWRQFYPLT